MRSRDELQEKLEQILGSSNVYFQPPETVKLEYPCIIYDRSTVEVKRADNKAYTITPRYTITVIDRNPESSYWLNLLLAFENIAFDRQLAKDNLYHFYLTLYY